MLSLTSLLGRTGARRDAAKRMIFRFRHKIIGPLAIFWLTVTVASVVLGAVAWSRFSRGIDASAEAEQFREAKNQLFAVLQDAALSQRGYRDLRIRHVQGNRLFGCNFRLDTALLFELRYLGDEQATNHTAALDRFSRPSLSL